MSTLERGGGAKKRFRKRENPNSSNQFLYLRAIEGSEEKNVVDIVLQDFTVTERIYRVRLPRWE